MISNKLFTEAIRYTVIDCSDPDSDNDIGYMLEDSTYAYINIYELAHKCKEWAFRHTDIYSGQRHHAKGSIVENYCVISIHHEAFYADTEQSAIFKACQWILDNKETK